MPPRLAPTCTPILVASPANLCALWSKQGSCTIPPEPEQKLHDQVSARGAHTARNEIDCARLDRLFSPGWLRSSSYDGSPLPSSLVGLRQRQRGCRDEFGMGLTMRQGCESNQRHRPTIPLRYLRQVLHWFGSSWHFGYPLSEILDL